ncbi:MAG: hypothetical protein F9K38_09395 [Pseudorhodoplanes sp.]|nr:MAG: hypothetical protein F9K38_09395 [Pseudorhodoplanes sp.]
MKDFTLTSLLAISKGMLGAFFWPAIVLAAIVAVLLVLALLRQRGFRGSAARRSVMAGLVIGMVAALVAPASTKASFSNLHGVLDWSMLVLIALAGFVGGAAAVFAIVGSASLPASRR